MGKGILLSGFALVIGLYATAIKKADLKVSSVSESRAYTIQADGIARTGTRVAINDLALNGFKPKRANATNNFFGGVATYNIDVTSVPAGQARITSTGSFNGNTVTIVTDIEQVYQGLPPGRRARRIGNSWAIVKLYETSL